MASKVFLDVDVIIDYLTEREPHSTYSALLLELHYSKKLEIYISTASVNTVYYVAKKLIGKENARRLTRDLILDLSVVESSKSNLLEAFDSSFKDVEDAIQYTTSQNIKGLEAIITRNVKDFKHAEVAIFTPKMFLETLEK